MRVFLPPTFAFKLVADEAAVADPGIFLNSTASRFQFIPSCIGSVNVDNTVAFDTVLTTSNYNGKLPQAKPFNVMTRINSPACAGLASLTGPPSSDNPLDEFYLRTVVSFLPQGGERTDPTDESIFLRNADGQENGLKLSITNGANQTIKLGPPLATTTASFLLLQRQSWRCPARHHAVPYADLYGPPGADQRRSENRQIQHPGGGQGELVLIRRMPRMG
ncbi:hypothetical protein WJ966_28245 [Achromobacter xylosoxidans]